VAAGVRHVEVGAETGLASRDDVDDIAAIVTSKKAAPQAVIGVIAGVGTARSADLRHAAEAGVSFIRVATAATRWREALPMIEAVRSLGVTATFNAITAHSVSVSDFARLAKDATSAGATVVYLVDSAGTMLPRDVVSRTVSAIDAGARVGFHGHDNLTLAVANSLAALDAGASVLDGTLRGIGRSAGNAQLEVLSSAAWRQTGVAYADSDALAKAAEQLIAKRRPRDRGVGYLDQCMGEGGFHSAELDAALRVAAQYNVPIGPLLRSAGWDDVADTDDSALLEAALALKGTAPASATADHTGSRRHERP
jgi:4-hydroxy-2-oxovalerate aldolase